ncbi:Gfo/Idh/MocA family protein [Nonomuraea sp. NPDC002799]
MPALKVGLVGAGGIAHAHAPAWRSLGAELHVFSLAGADELAATYGARKAESLDELLRLVSVVDVMTPTLTHHEITSRALAAGAHVFCEKPLARKTADAADLLRRASAAGRHLFPGHVVRYFPEYAAMRAAVGAGAIGRPAVLRFSRGGAFPWWSPWFSDTEQSGGLVMDQMIHDLDIARWVAGEVVEVYATQLTVDRDGQPVQTAHVVLTHADGAISHVRGLWGPPHVTFRTSFHVAGDEGVLHFDSADPPGVRLDLGPVPAGGEERPAPVAGESPYLTEIREFAEAIAGGPAARVTAADGVVAVELAEAALESLGSGEAVSIDTGARLRDLVGAQEPDMNVGSGVA